ncbi:hypothetical protein IMG5_031500 [Ichthyophthirius multifiliis]|uniref:Uncharacterized protein n=1 Tax=Ichthyophthirius multifiliis TaxID=5932 RepID=G0QLJ6_ICHMU|nr:hypothetical protein IMG5_031500 [Ichthyophthirius multifiliis]EGR33909.1 hypothetical protein IMG5_031500 [Ichthyophthirius multifiliis]|eukprot:XP_004039213.1 hypothetical protein IMG5_031500 [Ichthyophthirius multifiliis]
MANNLFLEDKKAYEMENPKQLLDIDYYFKLCNDKPIIGYIEDPIKSDDLDGWLKLKNKFAEKNVYISSSFLYSSVQNIKQISIIEDKDSKPDLNQQQIIDLNAKKFDLDCCHYRPFDFATLSEFLEIAKLANDKKKSTAIIIQDNFEEFDDISLIDLAFGLKNAWINLAPPLKMERIIKYNRLIEILQLQ